MIIMNNKHGFSAVVIIIILAVIAVGGYAVWKNQTAPPAPNSPPDTNITLPISNLDTSDWKTYRNDEYGFEMKYPTGWCATVLPEDQKWERNENCIEGLVKISPVPVGRYLIDNYNPVTIGGKSAGETGWMEAVPDFGKVVLFVNPSIIVSVSYAGDKDIEKRQKTGDRILSTFRFTK